MHKKCFIKYDKSSEEEQRIKSSYKTLFNRKAGTQMKLAAIDFLARFATEEEHKKRLESLYKREANYLIQETLKEVLDGGYQTPNAQGFLSDVNIDEIMDKYSQDEHPSVNTQAKTPGDYRYQRYMAMTRDNDEI